MSLLPYAAAWYLWKAATAIVRLIPRSEREQDLLDRLRAELRSLSPICDGPGGSDARDKWAANQRRLQQLVSTGDPRQFLTWDVIAGTMFVPFGRFVPIELAFLRQRSDWNRWRSAIQEPAAGLPFPYPLYPRSSANAIHQAYHLCRLEDHTGLRVHSFRTICEFGGGYGSMCRITRSLGFSGEYLIFDLPELSALQQYYLEAVRADAVTVSDPGQFACMTKHAKGPCLFIATWSLSESPADLRQQIEDLIPGFDSILIGYQDRFGEQDNAAFFGSWPSKLREIRWETRPIPHMPGNTYLFGSRQEASKQAVDFAASRHSGEARLAEVSAVAPSAKVNPPC